MELIKTINESVSAVVWGPVMLALLMGVGIFLSFKTGFFQVLRFNHVWKMTISTIFQRKGAGARQSDGKNVTPFQSLTMALASSVGVGNMAGVAGAIVAGGPGAVFWMWVSALFGMATKYSEIILAVKYRQVSPDGVYYGGPMYYIEKGLKLKWLAALFALFGTLACFGIGNATQAGEISVAVSSMAGEKDVSLATAVILSLAVGLVIFGGVKSISRITSYLVPIMGIFYVAGSLVVIFLHIDLLPGALALIWSRAFSLRSVGGGVFGYGMIRAMRFGVARGIFSNEAGLGSSSIAHAASSTRDPVLQGFWGVIEVFIDTICICTMTALVVIMSGLYTGGKTTGDLTAAAFGSMVPLGAGFVRLAIVFFALSTLLGWNYYGERCLGYLTNNSKGASYLYKLVYMAVTFLGTLASSPGHGGDAQTIDLIWKVADTLNGLMSVPNLIGLLLLSGVTVKLTRAYFLKDTP